MNQKWDLYAICIMRNGYRTFPLCNSHTRIHRVVSVQKRGWHSYIYFRNLEDTGQLHQKWLWNSYFFLHTWRSIYREVQASAVLGWIPNYLSSPQELYSHQKNWAPGQTRKHICEDRFQDPRWEDTANLRRCGIIPMRLLWKENASLHHNMLKALPTFCVQLRWSKIILSCCCVISQFFVYSVGNANICQDMLEALFQFLAKFQELTGINWINVEICLHPVKSRYGSAEDLYWNIHY